jgi:hypothetical protein
MTTRRRRVCNDAGVGDDTIMILVRVKNDDAAMTIIRWMVENGDMAMVVKAENYI